MKLEHRVSETDLTVTLHCQVSVQQEWHVEEVLWHSHQTVECLNRPVIAAPVLLQGSVLANRQLTVRIVLHQDAVRIRRALFLLVDVRVGILFAFVGRHELDLCLLVVWERLLVLSNFVELIVLLEKLG